MKEVAITDLVAEKISGEWGVEPSNGSATKVLRTTNFTNEGRLNLESVVEREIEKSLVERKHLKFGDTIIEKSGGGPKQPVGRVVFYDIKSDEKYLSNNFTAILRPSEKVFPKYFFYSLFFKHLSQGTLRYQNKTTGILNLKLERYLEEEKIKLPDLKTQQKIAGILEQADAARQKRKQANQLTEQFLQSTFLEMFGDPVRNEKGLEKKKIGDLILKVENENPLRFPKKEYDYIDISSIDNSQKIIVGTKRIDGESAPSRARQLVSAKDVIVSTVRPNLNAVAIVNEEYLNPIASTGFCVLKANTKLVMPQFIFEICKQSFFVERLSKLAKGASYPAVTDGQIRETEIPLPPLSLQKKFATLVQQVEQLRVKQRESEKELENLFGSLMQKYFE